jgi:hypothetical protein
MLPRSRESRGAWGKGSMILAVSVTFGDEPDMIWSDGGRSIDGRRVPGPLRRSV